MPAEMGTRGEASTAVVRKPLSFSYQAHYCAPGIAVERPTGVIAGVGSFCGLSARYRVGSLSM
jgi:hypothetical protein